ncbi:MAG: LuxR C-terminal-related transcriptional regulator [Phycisphaerales bacterium]
MPGVVDSVEDMMGTRLSDVLPACAARERELIHQQVMSTGVPHSHYQLSSDSRVLCSVFPLDAEAFGHQGILAVVKDARLEPRTVPMKRFPVLKTPVFQQLDVLSTRELEVFYFVGLGLSTREIAAQMNRAEKTVEHHVNSIHTKLDTHTRSQLVRFASERGIQAFSPTEWSFIVEGAQAVRREMNRPSLEIA